MAGLDPAIHVFAWSVSEDVDARDKRGHDESNNHTPIAPMIAPMTTSTRSQ